MSKNDKTKMYWRLAEKHGYRAVIAFLVAVIAGERKESDFKAEPL